MDEPTLQFGTPTGRRIKSLLWAALMTGCMLAVSSGTGVLAFMVLNTLMALPLAMAIVLGALPAMLMFYLGWKMIVVVLRFRIVLYADHAELGRGWLNRVFPYDDVEMIALPEGERAKEHGVGLRDFGYDAFVFLNATDEAACVKVLRQVCRNAVFVDRAGREYLPPHTERPSIALQALYRRYRSQLNGALWALIGSGMFAVASCTTLLRHFLGLGPPLDAEEMGAALHWAIVTVPATLGAAFFLRSRCKRMWRLREGIAEARVLESGSEHWEKANLAVVQSEDCESE